jgi:rRNA maturation endonuclease Nob1
MAETGMTFDEEEDEEPKEDEKKGKKGKKAKVEEVDTEELKRRQAVAAKAKDIATYGVSNLSLNDLFVAHLDLGGLPRGKRRN